MSERVLGKAKISAKYQVAIKKILKPFLDIKPGDSLVFRWREDPKKPRQWVIVVEKED